MIKSVEYSLKEENSHRTSKCKTFLNAKFSFKDEVAPKDWGKVREKLELPGKNGKGMHLRAYLDQQQNFEYKKYKTIYDNSNYLDRASITTGKENNLRELYVKSNKRRMTLEISVVSDQKVSKEGMFDVENLNKYILTDK